MNQLIIYIDCMTVTNNNTAFGKLIVCADEMITSNAAFTAAPTVKRFIRNTLDWFLGSQEAQKYAIISSGSNAFQSSFVNEISQYRECSTEAKDPSWLTFSNLQTIKEQWGGIFIAGQSPAGIDWGVLQNYVLEGGCVFLCLGTGVTNDFWKDLLGTFGIKSTAVEDHQVTTIPVQNPNDFILAGVESLYYYYGSPLSPADGGPANGADELPTFSVQVPNSTGYAVVTVEVPVRDSNDLSPSETDGWKSFAHHMQWSDKTTSMVVAYNDFAQVSNSQLYRAAGKVWIKNVKQSTLSNVSVLVGDESSGNRSWDAFMSTDPNATNGGDDVTPIQVTSLTPGQVAFGDFYCFVKHTRGSLNDPLSVLLFASPDYTVTASSDPDAGPQARIMWQPPA